MDTETKPVIDEFEARIYFLKQQVIEMEQVINTLYYDYKLVTKKVNALSLSVPLLAGAIILVNIAIWRM